MSMTVLLLITLFYKVCIIQIGKITDIDNKNHKPIVSWYTTIIDTHSFDGKLFKNISIYKGAIHRIPDQYLANMIKILYIGGVDIDGNSTSPVSHYTYMAAYKSSIIKMHPIIKEGKHSNGQLFLSEDTIEEWIIKKSTEETVTIDRLFPGMSQRIFCIW